MVLGFGNSGSNNTTSTTIYGIANFAGQTPVEGYVCISAGGVLYSSGSGNCPQPNSSRRFKEEIQDVGDDSRFLMALRPVSFRYRPEFSRDQSQQYGLIAEEVNEVAPQLVTRGDDGLVNGVKYNLVNALMLNELQRVARNNGLQQATIDQLRDQHEKDRTALIALNERVDALEKQVTLLASVSRRLDAIEQRAGYTDRSRSP